MVSEETVEQVNPFFAFSSQVINTLSVPAAVVDAWRLIDINAAWRSLMDAPAQAELALGDLIATEDLQPATDLITQAVLAGNASCIEVRLLTQGRQRQWFQLQTHPLPPTGHGRHCLITATDIHQQRQAQEQLRALTTANPSLAANMTHCIKLMELDGTLLHMNSTGHRALGIPEGAPLGMRWLSLLPADVQEDGEGALRTARAGLTARFTGRSELPDGTVHHWDNTLTPVKSSDGTIANIVCVSRDVTAESNALRSLEASRKRLEIAARVGGLGVWDYDIVNDELRCDDTWHRIMGRDPSAPVTRIEDLRSMIHIEDRERAIEVTRVAAELIESGQDYGIVFRIVRPDGEVRWIRSAARLEHQGPRPVRAIGFVVDVTESMPVAPSATHEAATTQRRSGMPGGRRRKGSRAESPAS